MRRIALFTESSSSYRAEPDTFTFGGVAWHLNHEYLHTIVGKYTMSFAHVLNVQPSEEGWLADATELFLPEFFATRLIGDNEVYKHRGAIWDHMRNELYRLSCTPEQVTQESIWCANHMLQCFESSGQYAEALFGQEGLGALSHDFYGHTDCEEDTLDSDDLLTEEYYAPDACQQMKTAGLMVSPQCPVDMFLPTEQEDDQ